MPAIGIRLLGSRQFTVDDRPWRFAAPPRTIPLLGYLVTAGGPTSREVLSAALWPEAGEDEGRVNLRRHLHHLQKALPPCEEPWVCADGEFVAWAGNATVDAIDFSRAYEKRDWNGASVLYGGEFLEGFYDEWIIVRRERLSAAYLFALTELLGQSRSNRDHVAALGYAQRILEIDEWREDVVRAAMAARYESGDRAGALGTYERFARRLAQEMRVDPMPETMALRDAIVRNVSISVAGRDRRQVPGTSSSAVPFVGRGPEFESLRSLWSAVTRNAGGLAFVSGEAGIGKTRLVHEFALYAERQGARVLVGGTSNPEATPYEALAEAIRSAVPYLAQGALDALWARVLATIVPELHVHLPDRIAIEPIGEHQERARLFEAFARVLAALGRTRPFLLILEDLQWAGSATALALEFVARRLAGIPGIVLATYRDDEASQSQELERVRRRLEREHRAEHIAPRRLSRDDIAAMLEAMPQFAKSDGELAGTLHQTSEGNPLFVVHLLRDFAETGSIRAADANGTAGIGATIHARVGRLSQPALLVAEHAAVAGRTFSVDLLRDATGWNEDDLLGALSELVERHLVRASFERSRYEYAFTHDLVRRAIYERIPERQRRRLHYRIAALCERAEADRPELAGETALHWDRAGESALAAQSYLRACDAALAVYANETARRYARRVLELAVSAEVRHRALVQLVTADERLGDKAAWERDATDLVAATEHAPPERRFEALACAVKRYDSVGDRDAQQRTLEEMKRIARESVDGVQTAITLLAEGTMYWRQGAASTAIVPLTAAASAGRNANHSELALEATVMLVKSLAGAGRIEAARIEVARAQEELREDAPLHRRLALLRASAGLAMAREDPDEVQRIAQEQAELARRVGDVHGEAAALRLFGYAAAYRGLELEAMRTHWSAAAELFERIGASQEYAIVLIDLAGIEVELGRYQQAEQLLAIAAPLSEQIGWSVGVAFATLSKAEVFRCRGEFDAARSLATKALEFAEAGDYAKGRCTALVMLGWLECKLGECVSGVAHLQQGIGLRRESEAAVSLAADLCMLIEGLLASANADAAIEAARELEQRYASEPQHQMAPEHICWTLARAKRAIGDEAGYVAYRARGLAELDRRSSRFKDPAIRAAFRERPFCREMLAAK